MSDFQRLTPEQEQRFMRLGRKQVAVSTELMTWMAVHGDLQLALRHPQNTGASATWVRKFVELLGQVLVCEGILTQAELDFINQYEVEQTRRM